MEDTLKETTISANEKNSLFDFIKDKFLDEGISGFNETQIIEMLLCLCTPKLNTGPIANRLIQKFQNLKRILDAGIDDLTEIDGVSENTALLLKLIAGIAQFYNKQSSSKYLKIDNQAMAKEFCQNLLIGQANEEFLVVCLNADNNVIGAKIIAKGDHNSVTVQVRSITEYTIKNKCKRIIIAHNHPFTEPKPSVEDISTTVKIISSCILNDINVIDHIISSPLGNYSFSEHCVLEGCKINAFRTLKFAENSPVIAKFCSSDPNYHII